MRIHADVGKCQGYGNCVALDTEDAVRSCPADALRLDDADA
jgi:ferredoxin